VCGKPLSQIQSQFSPPSIKKLQISLLLSNKVAIGGFTTSYVRKFTLIEQLPHVWNTQIKNSLCSKYSNIVFYCAHILGVMGHDWAGT